MFVGGIASSPHVSSTQHCAGSWGPQHLGGRSAASQVSWGLQGGKRGKAMMPDDTNAFSLS